MSHSLSLLPPSLVGDGERERLFLWMVCLSVCPASATASLVGRRVGAVVLAHRHAALALPTQHFRHHVPAATVVRAVPAARRVTVPVSIPISVPVATITVPRATSTALSAAAAAKASPALPAVTPPAATGRRPRVAPPRPPLCPPLAGYRQETPSPHCCTRPVVLHVGKQHLAKGAYGHRHVRVGARRQHLFVCSKQQTNDTNKRHKTQTNDTNNNIT
jgi:hypothetical protein